MLNLFSCGHLLQRLTRHIKHHPNRCKRLLRRLLRGAVVGIYDRRRTCCSQPESSPPIIHNFELYPYDGCILNARRCDGPLKGLFPS